MPTQPINPLNEPALNYWSNTKYTEQDLFSICREYNDSCLFAKIDFIPNRPLVVTVSSAVDRTRQGHYTSYFRLYDAIHKIQTVEPLKGSIIAWFEDGLYEKHLNLARRVPIFHVGKLIHDHYSFLIPDATFIDSNAHAEQKTLIDQKEHALTWKEKKNQLIWRGAASGIEILGDSWINTARIQLCLKAKELRNANLVDVAVSRIAPCGNKDYELGILDLNIFKKEMPFLDFLNYKYQLDIDGVSCAWLSCFLKLYSSSVMFKVIGCNQQWYYHLLKPWKHFIPITKELDNFDEVIDWAINHDKECQEISINSTELIKELTLDTAVLETRSALQRLFRAQSQLSERQL